MIYFIIIRGPLGVGKSTIAGKLAKKLNAEYFSIDQVLEEHGLDKIPIPPENFIKANEIMLPKIKEAIQKSKIIIFDGNFYYKTQIENLTDSLSKLQPQIYGYIFTLKAPVEICIKRDIERGKTHGDAAARVVHSLVSKFDYGTIINTEGKSADEVVSEIRSQIK